MDFDKLERERTEANSWFKEFVLHSNSPLDIIIHILNKYVDDDEHIVSVCASCCKIWVTSRRQHGSNESAESAESADRVLCEACWLLMTFVGGEGEDMKGGTED
jgi:hypothetical protein